MAAECGFGICRKGYGISTMREKETEQKLIKAVKAMGGIAPKFVSPGFDGMPDRLVLLPKGRIGFIELKATGKKPRALQLSRIKMLKKLGFKAYVIDDVSRIEVILNEIQSA